MGSSVYARAHTHTYIYTAPRGLHVGFQTLSASGWTRAATTASLLRCFPSSFFRLCHSVSLSLSLFLSLSLSLSLSLFPGRASAAPVIESLTRYNLRERRQRIKITALPHRASRAIVAASRMKLYVLYIYSFDLSLSTANRAAGMRIADKNNVLY